MALSTLVYVLSIIIRSILITFDLLFFFISRIRKASERIRCFMAARIEDSTEQIPDRRSILSLVDDIVNAF